MTYQYCHWYAEKEGIPYRTPPSHPFNPLSLLRLSVSQNNAPQIVSSIFDAIWGKGLDMLEPQNWNHLTRQLGIANPLDQITQQWVKDELKQNTENAIEMGLFGVPTISVKGKLFWGCDMTDMALAHLKDPCIFDSAEYRRLENLPVAQSRVSSKTETTDDETRT